VLFLTVVAVRLAEVRVALAASRTTSVVVSASPLTDEATASRTTSASLRLVVSVALAARRVSTAALRTVVTAPLPRETVLSAWASRSWVAFWLRRRLTSFSPRTASSV
jgi:hypothetical protein